jgi:hypothetical protein
LLQAALCRQVHTETGGNGLYAASSGSQMAPINWASTHSCWVGRLHKFILNLREKFTWLYAFVFFEKVGISCIRPGLFTTCDAGNSPRPVSQHLEAWYPDGGDRRLRLSLLGAGSPGHEASTPVGVARKRHCLAGHMVEIPFPSPGAGLSADHLKSCTTTFTSSEN